jgi:hypothetical protein
LYVPARGTSRLETQELKRRLTGLFPTGTRLHLAVETAPAAGGQAALPEERESAPRSGFPLALCGWLLIEALFRTFFWLDGRRLRAPWKVLVPALALGSLFVFPWLYWRRKRSA